MDKMATRNPQKNTQYPPSHNNHTTKKDHHRPNQQFIQGSYRNAQTSTPFKDGS